MTTHPDPFSNTWDAAIIGGGFAGLAAASRLTAAGRRVLIIERRAALAWECAWANRQELGDDRSPGWQEWLDRLAAGGALPGGLPDAGLTEIQANAQVAELGVGLLQYAGPVSADLEGGLVQGIVVGTKSGLRRISARSWIDASDDGELCTVLDRAWQVPQATRLHVAIAWRHRAWADRDRSGAIDGIAGASWTWRRSGWDDERILDIDLPGTGVRPRHAWLPAISALRAAAGGALAEAVVSHGSVHPYPEFAAGPAPAGLPANVATAIPGRCGRTVGSLSARWRIGAEAAAALEDAPRSAGRTPAAAPAWPDAPVRSTGVAIAGLGTGGALAAVAAARSGARVLAVEPLPFAGGIGSGGGIHLYYYGVRGGLQEEVDTRVRGCQAGFGPSSQIRCFHPDAKKAVLDDLIAEAGVEVLSEATLVAVRREGRRIVEALCTTPAGPVRIRADGWIDATGDGDLAAAAGCAFRYGRTGDGRLHAYTQSIACTRMDREKPFVDVTNFDSGFVDASDPADLTRARHQGVLQFLRALPDPSARPAQVCPAIGLRQDRQIATDAILGLDDLIERRSFPDAIALTGSHYDNHASDYELESGQAMLWVWGCDGWPERIAGEIPYGAIVAADLDDCWIASRCLGVSEEAHHAVRMQRDMQRIGEAAGLAAALAAGRGARAVDLAALRARLAASEALPADASLDVDDPRTGITLTASRTCRTAPPACDPSTALATGNPVGLWRAAHDRSAATAEALRQGLASADPAVSFRAALLLAWRRDAAARPRLVAAVDGREDGQPDQRYDRVPRWFAAAAFLRYIPDAGATDALLRLADHPATPFRGRLAAAITLEATIASGADRALARRIASAMQRLLAFPTPDAVGTPRRHLQQALPDPGNWFAVAEDDTWQLHLVADRIRARQGLTILPESARFRDDPRAMVRRAFDPSLRPGAATARAAAG